MIGADLEARMKDCAHSSFNWTRTAGVGYVECSSCHKHIPIEQAVATLDDRIAVLEDMLARLIVVTKTEEQLYGKQ